MRKQVQAASSGTTSMTLTLFAMPISQPARAVQWALEHAGTAYVYENTMPGKETRTKEYAAKVSMAIV